MKNAGIQVDTPEVLLSHQGQEILKSPIISDFKVLYTVTLYRKYTMAINFQSFCQAAGGVLV